MTEPEDHEKRLARIEDELLTQFGGSDADITWLLELARSAVQLAHERDSVVAAMAAMRNTESARTSEIMDAHNTPFAEGDEKWESKCLLCGQPLPHAHDHD